MASHSFLKLLQHPVSIVSGSHAQTPNNTVGCAQGITKNQALVAHVLGIQNNKVVARAKRLGGGFGGKETRSVPYTVAACVPAWHLKKPVRLCCDRDEDMQSSGHRHAFVGKCEGR